MPVHLFGNVADMPRLSELAKRRRVLLFEDAAQAHMARHSGKLAGTWGDGSAFSFYPTKNMTTGEGGMVVVRSTEIARRIRMLRNQGMEIRYQNEIVGLNNRMTEIGAAIGLVQLRKLSKNTMKRRKVAQIYLSGLALGKPPKVEEEVFHVFHQFNLLVRPDERDSVRAWFERNGIPTDVYYPVGSHKLKPFERGGVLPGTDYLTQASIALPMHPGLSMAQARKIVRVANSFHNRTAR